MLSYLQNYLTFENIFLLSNFFVLPFWLMLIFIPNFKITQIFVNSIIIPSILSATYIFVVYQIFLLNEPIFSIFSLYLGLDNLYTIFSSESFLLIFWLHFISINLFVGSWLSRDAIKYQITRKMVFVPLILVYFAGPVGLVFYWIVRLFYSKKIGFHD
jgi:hypothetical protein